MENKKYPFEEGDNYYTIDGNVIIESCWDDQSEELFDENPNRLYFATLNEAIFYYKYERNRDMLQSVISFIESLESNESKELLEGFVYFNDEPKVSLYSHYIKNIYEITNNRTVFVNGSECFDKVRDIIISLGETGIMWYMGNMSNTGYLYYDDEIGFGLDDSVYEDFKLIESIDDYFNSNK